MGFLTGATVLGLALGSQTTAIAEEYSSESGVRYYDSIESAGENAASGETILPITRVDVAGLHDGRNRYVIGLPNPPPTVSAGGRTVTFPEPGPETLLVSTASDVSDRHVRGPGGQRTLTIRPRDTDALFPESWIVASAETVTDFGATGAFVVSTEGAVETPFVSALWFFVYGTRQLVDLILLATATSGVLVLVTVYSVTRITVQERRHTIGVIRSTGGSPERILLLFGVRALLLTLVGAVAGYALGTVLVRTVLNVAVYAGLPTSLDIRLTRQGITILLTAVGALAAVGSLAGVYAAVPVVRCPPVAVTRSDDVGKGATPAPTSSRTRIRDRLDTSLLSWSALVPTTATLSVFMAFLLLITAISGVVAPLASADEQTITEPGAAHPFSSRVPQVYAETFREQGIQASAEIVLLEVRDGTPFLARGANYSAYRELSGITIVNGEAPSNPNEAVIGADLAQSLSVGAGDELTLGGLTRPHIDRVEIVGVFAGTGSQDDQLLVSLPVARDLAEKPPGMVQLVRTDRALADGDGSTVTVVNADASQRDNSTRIDLSLYNNGLSDSDATLDVRIGNYTRTTRMSVPANGRVEAHVVVPRLPSGTYRLHAGTFSTNVTVGSTGSSLLAFPTRVPTGSTPRAVVTERGAPKPNATVTVESPNGTRRAFTTGDDGAVRVPFRTPGDYVVTVGPSGSGGRQTVSVGDYGRAIGATLKLVPASPSVVTRPNAVATVTNPWSEPVTNRVTLIGPETHVTRTVSLAPGASTTIEARLSRQPPGPYRVALVRGDNELAAKTYRVQGDERLGAALASSGRQSATGGVAQAAEVAFGNIRVLFVSLIVLTAVMTIGGTTASFTRSIRAKRREIGIRRAIGARPRDILRLVLSDALRIGATASVLALTLSAGALTGLLALGHLRVFGITLRPTFSPSLLLAAGALGLGLALVSALAAAISLIRSPPASLLSDARVTAPRDSTGRASETAINGGSERE